MEAPDGSLAWRATKAGTFRREFVVSNDAKSFVLKAASMFRRECGVYQGERQGGTIAPCSWLSRRASAQFTAELPPELQAFMTWLTLLLWKRDADAGAGAG
jgi:hypothetical protein